jgi:hypothetical protein
VRQRNVTRPLAIGAVSWLVIHPGHALQAQVPLAHHSVLVVGYGQPSDSAAHVWAARQVAAVLDTLTAARYLSIVPSVDVYRVALAAGVNSVSTLKDLRTYGEALRADVVVGVSSQSTGGVVRLTPTLLFLADSVPLPARPAAVGPDAVSAGGILARAIANDSVFRTRRSP